MNENKIYRMVFEEIKESLEWSRSSNNEAYSVYVDGVISLADRMIRDLDKTNNDILENTNKR